jgi:geranylgeranyl transferase type-2 subunit beta
VNEQEPYLARLTTRLIEGIERLPEDVRDRHASYLRRAQNLDGGFSGRAGGSDLYYTGFALRSLAVLQKLDADVANPAARFLRDRMTGTASVIDLFSFVVSCYLVPLGGGPDLLADAPADWRPFGSTYTSFLVTLCLELLDRPIPTPDRLAEFVRSRRRPDGGFVEISAMKRSGTNPTAAGIGLLQMLDALEAVDRDATGSFLAALPSPIEGGLRANDRIPAADLLSTFTGGWTLDQLGEAGRLDWERIKEYAAGCERPSGGFRGGLWDEEADVEYTFYGLGTLALATVRLE